MAKFPPRLHVLFARNSDDAVILRRGPSRSVCSIGWNRRKDTFTIGQWLRGRIYERRCDLSPDGRHLIYFAMNGRWDSATRGAWTAISRVPYLKAIVLLGKGDCWHGGGLFLDKKTYWLNDGYGHKPLKTSTEVVRDGSYEPPVYYGGECQHPYFNRLQRDGWLHMAELSDRTVTVFEKSLPYGFILRKFAHAQSGAPPGKGCYWDEHEIERAKSSLRTDGTKWEWADLDSRRLVYAQEGKLFAAKIEKDGLREPELLRDFSDMQFEAIKAPY